MRCLVCQGRGTYPHGRRRIKCTQCGGKGRVAQPVATYSNRGYDSARDAHEREEYLRSQQIAVGENPFDGLFDNVD